MVVNFVQPAKLSSPICVILSGNVTVVRLSATLKIPPGTPVEPDSNSAFIRESAPSNA